MRAVRSQHSSFGNALLTGILANLAAAMRAARGVSVSLQIGEALQSIAFSASTLGGSSRLRAGLPPPLPLLRSDAGSIRWPASVHA